MNRLPGGAASIVTTAVAKRLCLIGCAALVLAGCSSSPKTKQTLLLFPSPPTKPRIQFLTWASGAEQVEGQLSGLVKLAFGDKVPDRLRLLKPYGVAARDGVVYVCDTRLPGLCRLDFVNNTFTVLGTRGQARLRKPIHLTIDPLGYKFVADAARRQIVVFGPDDTFVKSFALPQPARPVDVAVWGNELFVLDNHKERCRVVVMDRQTGEMRRWFGKKGTKPGEFLLPNSLCFDTEGYLYVSDTFNWRIQKLTREGESVWCRGEQGRMIGQFVRPKGIRVAPDGVLYVIDNVTNIVQMFHTNGDNLMYFGGPSPDGELQPGSMDLPVAVAVDNTSLAQFASYIHKDFDAEYLLFVSNQEGPYRIGVYAFGSFPEGYKFDDLDIEPLPTPPRPVDDTIPTAPSPLGSVRPTPAGTTEPPVGSE